MGVSVITCTHDRAVAFDLCQKWQERQTYAGDVQWIVADGGDSPAACRLGQLHIRTNPVTAGVDSFRANYLAALKVVKYDRIVFWEDDEYVKPDYLKRLVELFDGGGDIVGQLQPLYYNVRYRRYKVHSNAVTRTSLCQTGVRLCAIPRLLEWFSNQPNPLYLDSYMWRHTREFGLHTVKVDRESTQIVAMKGVTGTVGAGIGHVKHDHGTAHDDPHGDVLRQWIPASDVDVYLSMHNNGVI